MLLHEDPFDLIEKILKRLPKDHVGSANFAVLSLMEYEEKNTPSENVIKENNMKVNEDSHRVKKISYDVTTLNNDVTTFLFVTRVIFIQMKFSVSNFQFPVTQKNLI